jgi:DNA-3-methyladenine glycosylase II
VPDQPAASFVISPRGPFSLAEAATFGFGQRDDPAWDGVMRLAFCVDGYDRHAGVEVRQDEPAAPGGGPAADGPAVRCTVFADDLDEPALAAVRRQTERVLSLDYDGREFLRAGDRDPVIGCLQATAPGLRPPLFYSPYEAAAWAVLSSRRPPRLMRQVRDRLGQAHGVTFALAGQPLAAFPAPAALLGVPEFPGISPEKIDRLHGVARAALDGRLDAARLLDLGPEQAIASLQAITGIGPFYSELIVIRGTGFADVLPSAEPRVLALAAQLYGRPAPLTPAAFHDLARPWSPFRTWSAVLIRAVTPRLRAALAPAS